MKTPGVQLTGSQRDTALPVAPASWATQAAGTEDVCFVINAAPGSPVPLTPSLPGTPNRLVAQLCERADFLAQFEQLAQRCLEGERQHYEAEFDFPQAGRRRFEVNLYPNAAGAGSLPQAVAVIRDITERKRTEAAVQQSEEHYRDLFHQAHRMQENLRKMSDRILKIQEHERKRISRDLHDEVGQALTAINLNLAVLRNSLADDPPALENRIAATQTLIEHTMTMIHNFSRELRPAMLDDLGLLPTLRNYTASFAERSGLKVRLDVIKPQHLGQLDPERCTVIYRIVQEGLNNVAKHAQAKQVKVTLTGAPHEARLRVDDDGRGFAPANEVDGAVQQLGLLGLAERVRLVGGEFSVISLPDHGAALHATIPFKSLS